MLVLNLRRLYDYNSIDLFDMAKYIHKIQHKNCFNKNYYLIFFRVFFVFRWILKFMPFKQKLDA